MAIHELEARIKIGPIGLGSKVGPRVDSEEGISVDEHTWESGTGFDYQNGQKIEMPHFDYSGMFVHVWGANSVLLTIWADNETYGYTQHSEGLVGDEINRHPLVGKKLRYIPD